MFARPLSSLPIPPSSKLALQRAGFKTVADLGGLSAEQLSEGLSLPVFVCEDILGNTRSTTPVITRPAAELLEAKPTRYPICDIIDDLLGGGGLKKGNVLELSGPPGSPTDKAVISLVRSVVKNKEDVVFVGGSLSYLEVAIHAHIKCIRHAEYDSPVDVNARTESFRNESDIPEATERVQYLQCHTLPEILVFIHGISAMVEQRSNISLIVLNSFSFPFHAAYLSMANRASILDQIKNVLARLCARKQLTVVTTVQMATKLLGADGGRANFETGTKAILMPQLEELYLPPARSYRLTFILDSPCTGQIRLLSSPSSTSVTNSTTEPIQSPYEIEEGFIISKRVF